MHFLEHTSALTYNFSSYSRLPPLECLPILPEALRLDDRRRHAIHRVEVDQARIPEQREPYVHSTQRVFTP
jgi:hypothetical protein